MAPAIAGAILYGPLIDEEQVPVINNVQNYTKKDTIFIPHSTYDTIQIGTSTIKHITYKEYGNVEFKSLSDEITYNEVIFSETINPNFNKEIQIKARNKGLINTLLITTYTRVTEELITEPTPMLNPPLLIPLNEKKVDKGDLIIINLEYIMGGGLNTIKTNIK